MAETEQAAPSRAAPDEQAGAREQADARDEPAGGPAASAQPAGAVTRDGEASESAAQHDALATDSGGPTTAAAASAGERVPDGELAEVEEDLDELVQVAAQRDQYLALAQRTQADFENYRKRVAREAAAAQERGVAKLARELLPALDNLDRALEAAAEEEARRASGQRPAPGRPSPSDRGPGGPAEDSLLLEGVRLVRAELAAALGRVGIESFSPAGEPFDPEQHEAILQQPVEGAESGSVAEVYQPGYRLNGTIIRPARVVVAA